MSQLLNNIYNIGSKTYPAYFIPIISLIITSFKLLRFIQHLWRSDEYVFFSSIHHYTGFIDLWLLITLTSYTKLTSFSWGPIQPLTRHRFSISKQSQITICPVDPYFSFKCRTAVAWPQELLPRVISVPPIIQIGNHNSQNQGSNQNNFFANTYASHQPTEM